MAKPAVRVVHVETAHEKRVAKQVAQKKKLVAQKKRVQQVDRAVTDVTKTVFGSSAKPTKGSRTAPAALVSVDVSKVTTKALADVTSTVLTPRTPLELPTVTLPDLNVAVTLPALDLNVVDLAVVELPSVGVSVGLPQVQVDLPGVLPGAGLPPVAVLATTAPHASSSTSTAAASASSVHPAAAPLLTTHLVHPSLGQSADGAAAVTANQADGRRVVAAHVEAGVSLLAAYGASGAGAGPGVSPDGSAGAGVSGLMIFGLAVSAGLAGLMALHARPAHARSGHTLGLLRQPGFSPD
ncbi:hypothetical protein [Microlunatus antarcticus]|uniref:Uncharacterized protein n=1 Tax=Microlunatus antarcticus TaxID=53388 RepID=A0A7W5JS06_9ACTN|nr:hypothetical protein [Microlunatus antarcticus]MBB3325254.1 hypothetical protein [Microlunatus antarcticus]